MKLKEKQKGKNHDLTVAEYKVKKMLDKALDFMKQFVIDERSVLDRFKEKVDKVRDERRR
ncbi:hypothetical protein [uncultured Eubacterium sp.]|uniref:hypothetical protein n=1 Tax=uncultured Eubacterium sp. TaxID=165185 RepID=UPI002670D5A1|nr:hypothetical protein [uncultured Eubacterium sp.]